MKKIVWFLGCLFAWVSALTGEISLADAKSLLQKAEDNTCFYDTDMKGDYQIVHDKPGEGRNLINAILYRRDSQKKWTILITGPEKDKGKGYLQFDSNIWFYDPADKRFTFSSARDKFQNTNANTSDFAPQLYVSDYSMESYDEVKLGKFDCVVFNLKAVSKNVAYPELKLWVSKGDGHDLVLGDPVGATFVPDIGVVKNGSVVANEWVTIASQDFIDGIKDVKDSKRVNDNIYNLVGQRLSKPQKGINIIGGKKVLVK